MIQIKKTLSIFMAAVFVMAGLLGNITANAVAQADPTINFVGLDHTPLVAGDKETLTVTAAKYEGDVQYAAFMYNGTKWTKISGYGAVVDSKTPYALPATIALKAGKYPVSVWVRKAGIHGIQSNVFGDFDSFNSLVLNCVAKNANSVYTAGAANYKVEGAKVTFNGIDNIGGKVGPYLYQLFAMNTATGEWLGSSSDYAATPSYTFEEAGTYIVVAHVNTANSTKAYEGVKVISVTVKAETPAAVTITSVKAITPVNVAFGTAKTALGLPTQVTLNLSNSTTKLVDVTWANTSYNANASATYTFTGTYVCPTGVTGTMPAVTANVVVGVNPDLADVTAANAAILGLQTASAKDLTVVANLTAAEALVQPAKDAVVKVDSAALKITLTDSITLATTTITTARTAFDAKVAYTALKAGVETKVAAYVVLANGDLKTQALVDAAKTAKTAVVLTGINAADTTAFQTRIDAATVKVVAAQKAIDDAKTTVKVFNTTVRPSSSGFGSTVNVTLTTEGKAKYATATKYVIFDGADVVTEPTGTVLGTETTIFPKKLAGALVTVKLLDASGVVVETMDVKLGESGTIEVVAPVEVVTVATIKPSDNFGAYVTVTSNQVGAVQFQIWNDVKAVTAKADLGTSTLSMAVAGDKVTVKFFNAAGTVVATNNAVVLVAAK